MTQGSTAVRVEPIRGDSGCAWIEGRCSPVTSLIVLWHLLSLDAPTVAVVWTLFVASVTHTSLSVVTPVAMALAVWTLYAADRLLDSRDGERGELEPRHLFHQRHRRAFGVGIAISTGMLGVLLPMLPGAAIHLYLTEGAFVAGYFLLIHIASEASDGALRPGSPHGLGVPKELLVGPFFAAAIFIPTVSRHPEMRSALLPPALLLAALCSLNCLYIYAWEHPVGHRGPWATAYAVRRLSWIAPGFVIAASVLGFVFWLEGRGMGFVSFPLACAGSGLGLAALHRLRRRFSASMLRALADAVLLSPVLGMFLLGGCGLGMF